MNTKGVAVLILLMLTGCATQGGVYYDTTPYRLYDNHAYLAPRSHYAPYPVCRFVRMYDYRYQRPVAVRQCIYQ